MDDALANLEATAVESPRSMVCPGCGYDLRATASERCSECGLGLDREALQRSGFPWAHRKEIGQLRAFWKTAWLVTLDSETLRYEAAKDQSPRDAALFRRGVAAIVAACFIGHVIILILVDAIAEIALQDSSVFSRYAGSPMQDLLVPWSAGITIRPALFVYAWALAVYVVGAARPIFRTRGTPDNYRQAVEAISGYVVAPLVWLLPATAGYAAVFWLIAEDHFLHRTTRLTPILTLVSSVFAFVAVGGTIYRTAQWRARTAQRGYETGFLAMGELLVRWAVGCVVLLCVVPWCVGFVWIVIESSLH